MGTVAIGLKMRSGPTPVNQVPATLSGHGVEIDNFVALAPLTPVPADAMAKAAAISAARHFADKFTGAPATALLARVTVKGRPITDIPAWVITFTAPKPFTARGVVVSHYSVVLRAASGKLVFGFLTP